MKSEKKNRNSTPIDRRASLFLLNTSSHLAICAWSVFQNPKNANSFNLFPEEEKRQLELCIVTVIRTQFWAQTISTAIRNNLNEKNNKKSLDCYLEARLGSKALLTKKLGAGSNGNVYRLASYELRECLKDAMYYCEQDEKIYKKNSKKSKSEDIFPKYCKSRDTSNFAQDIIESLAACLEFDGLDNLTDPSPRSSLMISQFNFDKAIFVERMLKERTIPSCDLFLSSIFSLNDDTYPNLKDKCYGFVEKYYSSEIPQTLKKDQKATILPESTSA